MSKIEISLPKDCGLYTAEEYDEYCQKAAAAKETLLQGNGKGNDFLGWTSLPQAPDTAMLQSIKEDAARIKSNSQLFVVIGIGGSYLGARAVIEALQSELQSLCPSQNTPLVVYAGHTLSEDYYSQLLQVLDKYHYSVAVISKSGTTTESAIAFRIVKNHIEKKYGKQEARQRIFAITDAQKGALHTIATNEGYKRYIIPDNVGGRFSVLTPVGLLPIAAASIDIDQLMAGAADMLKTCTQMPPQQNPALQYAAIRNLLYSKGKKVEMLVSFLPTLRYISEWWKQLYGESEGKDHKGILPHSLCFTTDLHSMGQYVQDGERHLFETLISVEKAHTHVDIPFDEQNLDGLNYLHQKSLNDINHCAEQGTTIAHTNGGVPVVKIQIPEISAYTLGQLIYFFEFACGVSGYMLGVNPFDQPGVEAYKKNMFALLGKPGYEELRKTLENR